MDKKVMVYIYKNNGEDNSNHGVSSRVNETLLFAEGISDDEIRRICEEEGVDYKNALQIKTRKFSFGTYKHAVPVELKDRMTQFGGCFAWTSNAPFARMLGEDVAIPIMIHDRFETEDMGGY